MKKLVSRFMAVLMAMTMILSMSMTAFAAEAPKGTLTVNNTVAGKTLDLYQIFTATKNEAAKRYISGALAAMLDLGSGSGPMNHGFAIKEEW